MDRNSIPGTTPPVQAPIPEEDAHLLAIEALEARSIDSAPSPLISPTPPVHPPVHLANPPRVGVGVKDPVPPVPVKPQKPTQPATPAEAMADALAHSPETKHYQFFTYNKPPRKSFIIFGIIAILVGLGVGAYFTLR